MTEYRRWLAGRRLAAGIDVGSDAVRVAFVSRRGSAVGIERLEREPLEAPHDAAGTDWAAVTRALTRVAGRAGARLPVERMPAAMALSCREVAISLLDARLATNGPLEPAVLVEAERVTGIARDSLAIDWCVNDILHPGRVVIASADQARIDLRVEAAAAAGFGLTAIDGEAHAALRAIRQIAALEVEAEAPYAAIWLGAGGAHGWCVEACTATTHLHAPSPSCANPADVLRELARRGDLQCAFVGGELDGPDGSDGSDESGMAAARLAEIGDLLGCVALPFECDAYCRWPGIDAAARRSPRFAVAFGLGLRGVCE